jgi:hypothetical protein
MSKRSTRASNAVSPTVAAVNNYDSEHSDESDAEELIKPASSSAKSSGELLVNSNSKWRSAFTRGYTTLLMLGGFILLVYLGHIALVGLLFFIQIAMYKEIKRLSTVLSKKHPLASFRPLHWYWFFVALFFCYGRSLKSIAGINIPYHYFWSANSTETFFIASKSHSMLTMNMLIVVFISSQEFLLVCSRLCSIRSVVRGRIL